MMSEAKKRVPKRRFKEFLNADDWEQRKLNDLVTIRRGLTYKPSDIAQNGIRVLRSSNIDEDQFITSNDDVFVNIEAVNIPFAKNGDILITSANGSNRLVGKHTIISGIAENSAVHGGFMLLAESNNPLFTDALLSSNWYKRFINTYVAGGNGAIGNLSKSELESQIVMIPSEHEQAKIGQWYDNINQLITLHQLKLDKLQATKKALLQEMFPEEGQDKPKRRFKGFTDTWEQRKLLTVLTKIVDYRGRTPKKLGLDWSPTGHLALSALNVKMGYVDKTVDAHYGDDYLYSVWMKDNDLYEGQVLFTTEAPMGNVAQVPDDNKYILSQRTIAFVPDRRVISDNFLAIVLSAYKCQKSLINRASGGTAKGVSQKTLSEISLDIPQSLSEQDKVSELIKKLSKIIILHQRKLDKLKNLKQAYLNEMFV